MHPHPHAAWTSCPARLRIQAMRNRQRVLRRRAQGGTALHQGDADALLSRVRRLPAEGRRPLSRSRHHPPGHGQPLHAHAEGAGGAVRGHRRDLVVGPIHDALHPQTWKLAESGGDGGQHVQPPVPRQTTDRRYRRLAKTGSRMEPPRQSGQGHHSVEVHTPTGQKNTLLHNHAVKALETTGRMRLGAEKEAIILLAGPAAQRKFRPSSLRNYHGHSDRHSAIELMDYFVGSNRELEAYINWLRIRAEQLVADSFVWKTIEAVAAALFEPK